MRVTSGKLAGCGEGEREVWVWDKLPPTTTTGEIETLKKGSVLRGKDEFICGHVEGKMPLGYLNGDVE